MEVRVCVGRARGGGRHHVIELLDERVVLLLGCGYFVNLLVGWLRALSLALAALVVLVVQDHRRTLLLSRVRARLLPCTASYSLSRPTSGSSLSTDGAYAAVWPFFVIAVVLYVLRWALHGAFPLVLLVRQVDVRIVLFVLEKAAADLMLLIVAHA